LPSVTTTDRLASPAEAPEVALGNTVPATLKLPWQPERMQFPPGAIVAWLPPSPSSPPPQAARVAASSAGTRKNDRFTWC